MRKQKTNYKFIIQIIALLLCCIIGIGLFAYAKYQTKVLGDGTGPVATWSFKVNGETESFVNIELVDTIKTELIEEKRLAPGVQGSFAVEIDPRGSEVAIKYYVKLSDFVDKPTNLKFYTDASYTEELELRADGVLQKLGKIELSEINQVKYEKIYWKWDYRTGDTEESKRESDIIDTLESGKNTTLKVSVVGVQQNPNYVETELGETKVVSKTDTVEIPFQIENDEVANTFSYKVASVKEITGKAVRIAENPLGIAESEIVVRVGETELTEVTKTLEYIETKDGIHYYKLTLSGLKGNGKLEAEIKHGMWNKKIKTRYIVDNIAPEVTVTPETALVGDGAQIKITVTDANLSDENKYEYYASSSSEELLDGTWKAFTNGTTFTLEGSGLGTQYVWIKAAKDKAGNESEYTKQIGGENYIVKGPYVFDTTRPVIKLAEPVTTVEEEDGVIYQALIEVVEEGGYKETKPLSNLVIDEIQILLDDEIITPINKNLFYEETEDGRYIYTLAIKLRTWGKLEIKIGEGAIKDTASLTNEAVRIKLIDIYSDMEGDGTEENPYIIYSIAHLNKVKEKLNAYYKLGRNLSLSEEENWTPIGNSSNKFTGGFDGAGKIISDLTITGTDSYRGLFGYNEGTIKNVGLENVNVSGGQYTGGLIGQNDGDCTLCYVTGTVISNGKEAGGLVGGNHGTVDRCYANSTVTGTGSYDYGVLIGKNYNEVKNSYSTGSVKGTQSVAGLIGSNEGNIERSYTIAKVEGTSSVGGLTGYNKNGTATNSYWAADATGQETSRVGTKSTLAEMANQSLYTDWDFNTIWIMKDGLPHLIDLETNFALLTSAVTATSIAVNK